MNKVLPIKYAKLMLNDSEFTLIDLEDLPRLQKLTWYAYSPSVDHKYAASGSYKNLLHRMIMNAPDGFSIDHINGDTLDNRKKNLRIVTNTQNQWNSKSRRGASKFKGVGWLKKRAEMASENNGKRIYLGQYQDETLAAKAYDQAAKDYFGEYANVNFKDVNWYVDQVHSQAVKSGWWDEPRSSLEIHMLICTEIAEASEAYRSNKPAYYVTDKGKPEGEAVELADAIIRIFDYAGYMGWDLEATLKAKIEFNITREYRHGGKKI